jgi:hypothetical protein
MAQTHRYPEVSEESLFRGARSCLLGCQVLAKDFHNDLIISFGILAGNCTEAALKCHLLQSGLSVVQIRKLGHDLVKAWKEAVQQGLPFIGDPPPWIVTLNAGHGPPYLFRYLPHQYGVGVPRPDEVLPFLAEIVEVLRKRCSSIV